MEPMRAATLFIFLTLAASSVLAQNPTPAPAASTAPAAATEQTAPDTAKPEGRDRTNQRVEHIHVEDGGSRVDELRVGGQRSEEHTSELQSPCNLVCRLLLEKKKIMHTSEEHSS